MGIYNKFEFEKLNSEVALLRVKLNSQDITESEKNACRLDLEKKSKELIAIHNFYQELKTNSKAKFERFERKAGLSAVTYNQIHRINDKLFIDLPLPSYMSSELYREGYESITKGLKESINQIKRAPISALRSSKVREDEETIWQYRYALLIGFIHYWTHSENAKEDSILKHFYTGFTMILEDMGLDGDDELISVEGGEGTYLALYKKALSENILKPDLIIANSKLIEKKYFDKDQELLKKRDEERKRRRAEDEVLNQKKMKAKDLENSDFDLFKDQLVILRSNHASDGAKDNLINDILTQADAFVEYRKHFSYTLTDELTAEVIKDAKLMLTHFNLCLMPNLIDSRKENEKKVYEYAVSLSAKVENNHNDKNYKMLATVLLVVGLVVLALAIAAAIAASHGVFLGLIPFATSKAIMVTNAAGLSVSVMTGTSAFGGCLMAATFGIPIGAALTGCGASLFFNKKYNGLKTLGHNFAAAVKKAAESSPAISAQDISLPETSKQKI